MLSTEKIEEYDSGIKGVYAFRIKGEVERDDMKAMSERMNAVFDSTDDKVDMLLVFDTEETSETGASWSGEAMKAQVKSLSNVRNYVVANAPGQAGSIVETTGKAMPVDARAFDTEAEALAWLRNQPKVA
jgi:hypothetical protein